MQVMPFWPENLGMRRHQLIKMPENIRMGCAILRFYLERESDNVVARARPLQRQQRQARVLGQGDRAVVALERRRRSRPPVDRQPLK